MKKKYYFIGLLIAFLIFAAINLPRLNFENLETEYQKGDLSFLGKYSQAYRSQGFFIGKQSNWKSLIGFGKDESPPMIESWKNLGKTTNYVLFDVAGFSSERKFRNSPNALLFGFLTGLILWIYSGVRRIQAFLDAKLKGKDWKGFSGEFEAKEKKNIEWIHFIAGKFWKVPLFAVGILVLMYVPILNRFIELITLQFFNLWDIIHAFIFALWIGGIPQFIEDYGRAKAERKVKEDLRKQIEGIRKQRIQGEIK
jgi:hypothetical protein